MAAKDRAKASAQPVVLVLASGRGERFAASGGMVHKLRAALGDKTVLEHTLAAAGTGICQCHCPNHGQNAARAAV